MATDRVRYEVTLELGSGEERIYVKVHTSDRRVMALICDAVEEAHRIARYDGRDV